MAYWWVSHSRTFTREVGGGYLWSPQEKKNGIKNPFYQTMLQVQIGDIVFSYSDTFIRAVGIVTGPARDEKRPLTHGQDASEWNDDGWLVPVEFQRLDHPFQPRDFMERLNPLLPAKYSPLQASGRGQQGGYLTFISDEIGSLLLELSKAPTLTMPALDLSDLSFVEEEEEILSSISLSQTQKETLVLARRGQGLFRKRVQIFEERCRVTDVESAKVLIASHIKPWSESEPDERLDGNNGLFLAPHVDKLFNDGFITFTTKGKMEVSPQLPNEVLAKWFIDPKRNFGKFNAEQKYYLTYHNEKTFKSAG